MLTYRFIVREMLNDSTYEVSEADSGIDGLRLTHELAPAVILLDLRLEDMTGIEVSERLRSDPKTGGAPLTRHALRTAIHDALSEPSSSKPKVQA